MIPWRETPLATLVGGVVALLGALAAALLIGRRPRSDRDGALVPVAEPAAA